jgi:hypothetical protein
MRVTVRYGSETIPISLKQVDASVQQLQSLIRKELGILPAQQRLIFKGKTLNHKRDKLRGYGITDGSKLLLVTLESDDPKDEMEPRRPRRPPRSERTGTALDPHVISLGPPPGCLEGMKTPSNVLPKQPFIIYNTTGHLAKLSIESEAFWVECSSDENERIFYGDVRELTSSDVEGYEDRYSAIVLKAGVPRVFYFVPKQYTKLIESICAQ